MDSDNPHPGPPVQNLAQRIKIPGTGEGEFLVLGGKGRRLREKNAERNSLFHPEPPHFPAKIRFKNGKRCG